MRKFNRKIETPIIPRPVILGLSKKIKLKMHKQTLALKWVQEYKKATFIHNIYRYYKHLSRVYISPLSKSIRYFKGDGRRLNVYDALLYSNTGIFRASVIRKSSSIREYALQILLWNYMYELSHPEFLTFFAMPLPADEKFKTEFLNVYKLYEKCTIRPVDINTHKAFKDLFTYFEKEDDFIEDDDFDENIYDDYLDEIVYHYLKTHTEQYYTNILPDGWSSITYDLILEQQEDKKKNAAEWVLNLKYNQNTMFHLSMDICKAITIVCMAGIDHNDLAPRNILIMIPTYMNYDNVKVAIVDFGLSQLSHEELTYQSAFKIAIAHLYHILNTLIDLGLKTQDNSFHESAIYKDIIDNIIEKIKHNIPNTTLYNKNNINIMKELKEFIY